MRPTQCVGGLYLTVVDLLAPLPINNNDRLITGAIEVHDITAELTDYTLIL